MNVICKYFDDDIEETPLHHFKLPIWMFGFVLYESIIQYPKVVTATELSKKLKIGYKAVSLLKRRFQLFASDQLPKYKQLTFKALEDKFKDFLVPPNENKDITSKMRNKPYVCVDTAVLYSAGERANHGRKRYRHSGATSSIYLSEKLGGRQVGTLVQTIAIKQGPLTYLHSTFHRSVNHSARSKDNKYKFARNRWSKNANVFGLDVLVEAESMCGDRDAFRVNPRARKKGAVRIERKGCLSI